MAFGKPFTKGTSGNPGGRAKIATAIKAAGFDPDDLRKEVIEQLVNGMRNLDSGSKDEAPSWRFCVDRLDVRLNGPMKEYVQVDEGSDLTDAQYAEECAAIAREHLAALTPEERLRLAHEPTIANATGSETVQ